MDLTGIIRDIMMKERHMFAYRGDVTSNNSTPLLLLLEKEIKNSELGLVGRKRLFHYVVESLQNVSRHASGDPYAGMSLVVYSKAGRGYTVTTGNVVDEPGVQYLKERLEKINSLGAEDLRELYRQMISNAEFSSKGGAGLGLIEMAKKTGNKLDFDFIPVNDHHSYFILSKTVDENGIGVNPGNESQPFRFHAISGLERTMQENNILVLWCGHISDDIGKEVLSLTETNLSEDDVETLTRRRVFRILVEMLENVARYSPGREAEEKHGMSLAIIRTEGNSYILTTGNLMLNSDIEILREKLDTVNSHDRKGLKQFYVRSLSQQTFETDSTGNMGLIEMARKSGGLLRYEFERISDLYSYFIVTVRLSQR